MKDLVSIAIITNGKAPHLKEALDVWKTQFKLGVNLFLCGPATELHKLQLPEPSIIDFSDEPGVGQFFAINAKKLAAGKAISSEYVYFVHDRFYPSPFFHQSLTSFLKKETPDFGSASVQNLDGVPSVRELRLHKTAVQLNNLEAALEKLPRLVCTIDGFTASDHLAVNGGQFFLRSELLTVLERPLRWFEMEDDILSYDLIEYRGAWLNTAPLLTIVSKPLPDLRVGWKVKGRYVLYRWACSLLSNVSSIFSSKKSYVSCGQPLTDNQLDKIVQGRCVLVDPLHKKTATDFLPSSLEKMMARARVRSRGVKWRNVKQVPLGWLLS